MKAILLEGANQFHSAEIPRPEICADELLVKMERAVIWNTHMPTMSFNIFHGN